jgi:hypothetical protein
MKTLHTCPVFMSGVMPSAGWDPLTMLKPTPEKVFLLFSATGLKQRPSGDLS